MTLTGIQKRNIAIGGILTLIVGIGIYVYRQYDHLVKAGKKLIGAKVHNLSLSGVNATVYVEIDNKGDLSVDVIGQDYNIYVNDKFVSNVKVKDDIRINSNGKSILPLTINFNPQTVLMAGLVNLTSILSDKSKIIISVKGSLSIKTGVLSVKNFGFNVDMTLAEIVEIANETA